MSTYIPVLKQCSSHRKKRTSQADSHQTSKLSNKYHMFLYSSGYVSVTSTGISTNNGAFKIEKIHLVKENNNGCNCNHINWTEFLLKWLLHFWWKNTVLKNNEVLEAWPKYLTKKRKCLKIKLRRNIHFTWHNWGLRYHWQVMNTNLYESLVNTESKEQLTPTSAVWNNGVQTVCLFGEIE